MNFLAHSKNNRDINLGSHGGGGICFATTALYLADKALNGDNKGTEEEGDFFLNTTSEMWTWYDGEEWREAASLSALASTTAGEGLALLGYSDAAASVVGTDGESVLDEITTPPTLTVAAEDTEAIAITMLAPATHAAQYLVTVYGPTGVVVPAASFTVAVTVGSEVFKGTTNNTPLLFTTSAAGAATITVTDLGATTDTLLVVVQPASASAGLKAGIAAATTITFA